MMSEYCCPWVENKMLAQMFDLLFIEYLAMPPKLYPTLSPLLSFADAIVDMFIPPEKPNSNSCDFTSVLMESSIKNIVEKVMNPFLIEDLCFIDK